MTRRRLLFAVVGLGLLLLGTRESASLNAVLVVIKVAALLVFVDNVSVAKKGYSGTRTYVRDGTGPRVDLFSFDPTDAAARDPEGRLVTTFCSDRESVMSP